MLVAAMGRKPERWNEIAGTLASASVLPSDPKALHFLNQSDHVTAEGWDDLEAFDETVDCLEAFTAYCLLLTTHYLLLTTDFLLLPTH